MALELMRYLHKSSWENGSPRVATMDGGNAMMACTVDDVPLHGRMTAAGTVLRYTAFLSELT